MKSLIIIFLFLCVNIYSQSWNTIDTTDIPVSNSSGERIALFSNHNIFIKQILSFTDDSIYKYVSQIFYS